MATKKAAAKKAPAKQATKTTAAKKTAVKAEESAKLTVKEVGKLLHAGSRRWGTGRDRDTNLVNDGYDLNEVREAVEAARAKELGV